MCSWDKQWKQWDDLSFLGKNHFWLSVPAEGRHTKWCHHLPHLLPKDSGAQKKSERILRSTSWHADEGKCAQVGMAGAEGAPATPGPGAVEAEETVFEAIHCVGRAGKGIPSRKHWRSSLLLCPVQTYIWSFWRKVFEPQYTKSMSLRVLIICNK